MSPAADAEPTGDPDPAGESWPGRRGRHGGIDEIPLPQGPGRLWLCGKHFVGPDIDAALASVGATTVVCLNERRELADRYPEYVGWLDRNQPVHAIWCPIADLDAPTVDDAVALLDELRSRVSRGEDLVMHCAAGIGRAGTMAAALLITMGEPVEAARRIVADHRPTAGPEAGPQAELLVALARRG